MKGRNLKKRRIETQGPTRLECPVQLGLGSGTRSCNDLECKRDNLRIETGIGSLRDRDHLRSRNPGVIGVGGRRLPFAPRARPVKDVAVVPV